MGFNRASFRSATPPPPRRAGCPAIERQTVPRPLVMVRTSRRVASRTGQWCVQVCLTDHDGECSTPPEAARRSPVCGARGRSSPVSFAVFRPWWAGRFGGVAPERRLRQRDGSAPWQSASARRLLARDRMRFQTAAPMARGS
jgi:hypothetical protein